MTNHVPLASWKRMTPQDIEKRSFEIISEELAARGIFLPREHAPVVGRCIHASADFDYARNLHFSENAVERLTQALAAKSPLVTDTRMALAGLDKRAAKTLGVELFCFMADEDVAREAEARRTTRAAVAVEKAVRLDRPAVFVVGNAPTALLRLCEAMQEEHFSPAGVVAAPVGFVNVVEAKELAQKICAETDTPCVVALGRKGGSAVAAAIGNALLRERPACPPPRRSP